MQSDEFWRRPNDSDTGWSMACGRKRKTMHQSWRALCLGGRIAVEMRARWRRAMAIEELSVWIAKGVAECRTISRISDDQHWDPRMVTHMRRVPWEVVSGILGVPVPVETTDDGNIFDGNDAEDESKTPIDEEYGAEPKFRGGPNRLHISREAL